LIGEPVASVLLAKGGSTVPGYTYAGNPLSCSAGLAVLRHIRSGNLVEKARLTGDLLQAEAAKLLDAPLVGDVRGKGLMLGVELVTDKQTRAIFPRSAGVSEKVHAACWERGLSYCPLAGDADGVGGDMASIGPPLVLTAVEAREIVRIFGEAVTAVAQSL
jgi:adenosylmethionine-8-amino-7-oxononanoate aminotransferase